MDFEFSYLGCERLLPRISEILGEERRAIMISKMLKNNIKDWGAVNERILTEKVMTW